ncbi:MAG: alpha amylase C-terminal domain-containing protein, partial [Agathobacter sp.]|nr:alpha amylase C-terminal domain-containing protein [Agathobacter sp.]
DKAMIALLQEEKVLTKPAECRWIHQDDKLIIYNVGDLVFVFNFHPVKSFDGYYVPVPAEGEYQVILSSDDGLFVGQDRVDKTYRYTTIPLEDDKVGFQCYLPNRSAFVLKKVKGKRVKKNK